MAPPVVITVQQMKGPFADIAANAADYTMVAGTITDGNTFVCTGREILLARNINVGAQTITIVSEDDEDKRSENIAAYSIGPSEYAVFGIGLTNQRGWKSTTGLVRITVGHADVLVAVLRLPSGFPN